jgi:hypothetical protein
MFGNANRLVNVRGAGKTISYTYSGLGDRFRQTVGITTTNYTLDTSTSLSAGLVAGLTQVLSDGTDTYLYGNGRIAQSGASGAQYFLKDAPSTGPRAGLGSVRQLKAPLLPAPFFGVG